MRRALLPLPTRPSSAVLISPLSSLCTRPHRPTGYCRPYSMISKPSQTTPSPLPNAPEKPREKPSFPLSSIPSNPLGEGKYIRTAAALIIGDEILNGKTLDRNSHFFAQYCFEQGVQLKRVEVVADNEIEIIEASRRMVRNYDLVITTGGIGPTHDDITYASLAKSFNQTLEHHGETLWRMAVLGKYRRLWKEQNAEQLAAMHRMALFPGQAEVLFVSKHSWVPVVRLEGKLCIFPGIPSLFQRMLTDLTPFLPLPPQSERPQRIQIFTERVESMIAPYLTDLQKRVQPHGIQVGSYPVLGKGVFVSLIGRDTMSLDGTIVSLGAIAREVEIEIDGQVVSDEEVALKKGEVSAGIQIKAKI